jgi:hypothetical protein
VKQNPAKIGRVDVSDLSEDRVVRFQHKYYLFFGMILLSLECCVSWMGSVALFPCGPALVMGFIVPTLACGLLWGDYYVRGLASCETQISVGYFSSECSRSGLCLCFWVCLWALVTLAGWLLHRGCRPAGIRPPQHVLREFTGSFLGCVNVLRRSHGEELIHHGFGHGWRRLPQLPPRVPLGFPKWSEVVSV